jgi:vesicle transport protein SEC22
LQEGFSDFRSQTKALLLKLSSQSENNSIVEFDKYLAHIKITDEVAFICFCEKSSSKNVAFAFLNELSETFFKMFTEGQIMSANRPYALIKFEATIHRVMREYQNARSVEGLSRIKQDLSEVQSIMTENINEVLERGNKLDYLNLLSGNLAVDSKRYLDVSRDLNLQAFYKNAKVILIAFIFICIIIYIYTRL